MHRFFCDTKQGDYFILDKELLRHIKVARLQNDQFLINFQGEFYKCNLIANTNKAIIHSKENIDHEFKGDIVLAAPIIKPSRFEIMLEKAVELGVKKIIPLISHYCNRNQIEFIFGSDNKINRLNTKIKEAAQQSFRNIIPYLDKPTELQQIIKLYKEQNYTIYVAHELIEPSWQIDNLATNCLILVGPEGGFSQNEIDNICEAAGENVKLVSLGKRILRAETAAITMLAKIKET